MNNTTLNFLSLNNPKLKRPAQGIFNALERLLDIVEQDENSDELLPDLRLAFRLINAEMIDRRFGKKLSHILEKISAKKPALANVLKDLETESKYCQESMNFNLLLGYGHFCREKFQKNVKNSNCEQTERISDIVKRGKLVSSYIEEE